jgi:hypothetical protein
MISGEYNFDKLNILGKILAKGNVSQGETLGNIGSGAFLIFYPRKAAFRAGAVFNNQWDDDNIGNFSFAGGKDTIASGNSAVALGYDNIASGEQSFAAGLGNTASGNIAIALGHQNTASGKGSVALGYQSIAQAFGSIALGVSAQASGYGGVAIGDSSQAIGSGSIAAGFHTKAGSLYSIALGTYNVGFGNPTNWVDTDPIFELGIGTSESDRKNAITILKNGNVGVGQITNPSEKFVVGGNIGLQANTDVFVGTLDNYALIFKTNNIGRIFITNDGKIRVGQNTSSLNLLFTVNGDIETTGSIFFTQSTPPFIGTFNAVGLNIGINTRPVIIIGSDGKVRIGQTGALNNAELTVLGDIGAIGNIFISKGEDAFIGTLDNYALSLRTNNNDRIYITNDGKVGIGIAPPQAKLDVAGAIRHSAPTPTTILFYNTNESGTPSGDGFRIRYEDNFYGPTADALIIEKTDGNQIDPDGGISFVNTGSDGIVEPALTIRGNGYVGIGPQITNPSERLVVGGNIGLQAGTTAFIGTLDNYALSLRTNNTDRIFIANDGKVGIGTTNTAGYNSKLAVEVSDTVDVRVFTGFAPSINTNYTVWLGLGRALSIYNSGWIGFRYIGNQSANNFLTFGLYGITDVLVITGNRNVGIRNTSPTYALQIGSAGDGTSAIANAWNTYSDIRLKEIVGEIKSDEALEKILNLQAKRFYYKSDENKKVFVGFIAQEVEKYIPEVVSTDSSEEQYKAIAYDKIIPFIVEAIKHLYKLYQELKEEKN